MRFPREINDPEVQKALRRAVKANGTILVKWSGRKRPEPMEAYEIAGEWRAMHIARAYRLIRAELSHEHKIGGARRLIFFGEVITHL